MNKVKKGTLQNITLQRYPNGHMILRVDLNARLRMSQRGRGKHVVIATTNGPHTIHAIRPEHRCVLVMTIYTLEEPPEVNLKELLSRAAACLDGDLAAFASLVLDAVDHYPRKLRKFVEELEGKK